MSASRLLFRVLWHLSIWLGAGLAVAAEPPTRPLPRLETGMHTARIKDIAADADGRWAVTASWDKTARVWDLGTGQQVAVLRPPQADGKEGQLYAVAWPWVSPRPASTASPCPPRSPMPARP